MKTQNANFEIESLLEETIHTQFQWRKFFLKAFINLPVKIICIVYLRNCSKT